MGAATDWDCTISQSVKWMFGIELLMVFCGIAVGVLNIIRTYARRSAPLHYAITIAYPLSIPIITYTLNTAVDVKGSVSPLFVVSAVVLHLIFIKINIAVMGDNEFFGARRKDIWTKLFPTGDLVGLIWIGFLLLIYSGETIPKKLKVPTCIFIGLGIIQVILNYLSLDSASGSLAVGKNSKLVRSYLAQYPGKLLVMGEEQQTIKLDKAGGYCITETNQGDLITLDKALDCDGDAVSKDLCISFALFKLLRAQVEAGRHQPADDSSNPTAGAQTFLGEQLLHKADADYKRMFGVIARELAFLNDYLFSTLPFAFHSWFPLFNVIVLFLLLLCCLSLIVIIVIAAFNIDSHSFLHEFYKSPEGCSAKSVTKVFHFDVSVCLIILMVPVGMDAWEIFTYLSSDWVRVALFCKYVKYLHNGQRGRPSLVQKAFHLLCRVNTQDILRPYSWSNTMNQRCILKRRATKFVKVPDAVKEGIFNYLVRCEGRLSNASVRGVFVGNVEESAESYWMESHTERILLWHIATSQCDQDQHTDQVASCLSRYCYYLVTARPVLMGTDDTEWVRKIVQDVANNVGGCTPCFGNGNEEEFGADGQLAPAKLVEIKGRELGKRLMDLDEDGRWAKLAGVWIEIVMYVAASGDVEAHTNLLGQGGEFITHVWALLNHLGIN